jgi:quercetin dioxygenase-like cupin family protein
VILFSFAAGGGLAEHVAPFDATIQIISGTAALSVGEESVEGKPGTWIQMVAKTPHSIKAASPVVMLLALGPVVGRGHTKMTIDCNSFDT